MSSMPLAVALLTSVLAPFQDAPTDNAIERAYRGKEPFRTLAFEALPRPPFVFCVEKGSSGWLPEAARQAKSPLAEVIEVFDQRFGKEIGKAEARPVVVWVLAGAESFGRCGGPLQSAAVYDRLGDHVLVRATAFDANGPQLLRAEQELMRGLVLARLHALAKPGATLPAWLCEGIAERVATTTPRDSLRQKLIGFGYPDEKRIQAQADVIWHAFDWQRLPKIDVAHNPLHVVLYPDLDSYMASVGVGSAQDREEQIDVFRDAAYAVVTFLDIGFQGAFRPKLLATIRGELEGRTGLLLEQFAPKERELLLGAFRLFAPAPTNWAGAKMPDAKLLVTLAGGRLFKEPAAGVDVAAPSKTAPLSSGATIALALHELRSWQLERAAALVEGRSEPEAERIAQSVPALARFLADYGKLAAEKRGLRLYPGTDVVVAYQQDARALVLRGGALRPLSSVPPDRLAQSAWNAGIKDLQPLLLPLAVQMEGLDKAARSEVRRNARLPASGVEEWVGAHRDALAALSALDRAAGAMRAGGGAAIDQLAKDLSALPKTAAIGGLVEARLPDLLTAACSSAEVWTASLRGKVSALPGDRIRIVYDWSSAEQTKDWLAVRPTDRFAPAAELGDAPKLEAVSQVKQARLQGLGAVRHCLQFTGDVSVAFEVCREVANEEAGFQTIRMLPPGSWLLCAQPPGTFVGGSFSFLQANFSEWPVNLSAVPRPDLTRFQKRLLDGKGMAVAVLREGSRLRLRLDGKDTLDVDVAILPNQGAVLWYQADEAEEPGQPTAVTGPVTIEGKPHPQSLERCVLSFRKSLASRLPAYPSQ